MSSLPSNTVVRSDSPFGKYRVLDLTDEKGLMCGKILADIGFDVIKVEPPSGSPARKKGPFYHDLPDNERSLLWMAYNTNKRSISLNLECADGKQVFNALVKDSHFVLESFEPGYMDSLGLGYERLKTINPGLIMTSISFFGQTGPWRNVMGSDLIALAESGFMFGCGDPDRAPIRFSLEQTYLLGSLQATAGTMIAHHARRRTGRGQHVDVSIREAFTTASWGVPQIWYLTNSLYPRVGTRFVRWQNRPNVIWRCSDGYVAWMLFTGQQASRTLALIDWMDEHGMAGDLRSVHWSELDAGKITQEQLAEWEPTFETFFLSKTRADLYANAVSRGIMLFPVSDFSMLPELEQLKSRGYWIELEHPDLCDRITYPGAPVKSTGKLWDIRVPAPRVGQHNEEVLCGELGITRQDLLLMKQAGVI